MSKQVNVWTSEWANERMSSVLTNEQSSFTFGELGDKRVTSLYFRELQEQTFISDELSLWNSLHLRPLFASKKKPPHEWTPFTKQLSPHPSLSSHMKLEMKKRRAISPRHQPEPPALTLRATSLGWGRQCEENLRRNRSWNWGGIGEGMWAEMWGGSGGDMWGGIGADMRGGIEVICEEE